MSGPDRRVRIAIAGSYGGMNLGDEAILQAILRQLRDDVTQDVVAFSRHPDDTERRHGIEALGWGLTQDEVRHAMESIDVFILGGGGILHDRGPEVYLRYLRLAHESGVPVIVYGISAGPLTDASLRERIGELLGRCEVVTVRDRFARQILEEIGIEHVEVTADPALLLEAQPMPESALRSEGIGGNRPIIGFSVREPGPAAPELDPDHYHALLANAADFMVERLAAQVVFIPMERENQDIQHSHAVVAKMQNARHATVLRGEYSPPQLIGLANHFAFAVGMRLHFLIFAALAGVPFIALPYASKVHGLVADLELDAPPMERVTVGQLIAVIDRAWDHRDEIRVHVTSRLPALQARARMTHQRLLEMLQPTVV